MRYVQLAAQCFLVCACNPLASFPSSDKNFDPGIQLPAILSLQNSEVEVSQTKIPEGGSIQVALHLKDLMQNPYIAPGQIINFALSGGTSQGTFSAVVDQHNGTYTSEFSGTLAGTQSAVTASVNGDPLSGNAPSVAVINLFSSGMEMSGFSDWDTVNASGGLVVQSSVQHAHGNYSLRLVGDGNDNRLSLTKSFPAWSINSTHYIRVYVYVPSGSLGPPGIIWFLHTPSNDQFNFHWNGSEIDGFGFVGPGGNYINGVATNAFTLDTWHYLEIEYIVSATVGGLKFSLDGVSLLSSFTSDTSGDVNLSSISLGNEAYGPTLNAGSSLYYDDFQMSDDGPIGPYNAFDQ